MQVFFTTDIREEYGALHGQESVHCVRVLRHKVGDRIHVVDGKGSMYLAEIRHLEKASTAFVIVETEVSKGETSNLPEVAFGLLKNDTRTEWMIEKLVEIGVSKLTPLICEHSEKNRIREERLGRIMVSAMKQSQRRFLPELQNPQSFSSWILLQPPESTLVAHYQKDQPGPEFLLRLEGPATLVIGPEGDFSTEEIIQMQQVGMTSINLGDHRLRSETAAIVGCTLLNLRK